MKIKVEIDCGNAAFDDGNWGAEVARILREAASTLEPYVHGDLRGLVVVLRDINGNRVGAVRAAA